jgi:hypothetical protein
VKPPPGLPLRYAPGTMSPECQRARNSGEENTKYLWKPKFQFNIELSFPHFRPVALYGVQMGELEGGKMPRTQRSNPKIKHHAVELRKELMPAYPVKNALDNERRG